MCMSHHRTSITKTKYSRCISHTAYQLSQFTVSWKISDERLLKEVFGGELGRGEHSSNRATSNRQPRCGRTTMHVLPVGKGVYLFYCKWSAQERRLYLSSSPALHLTVSLFEPPFLQPSCKISQAEGIPDMK